MSSPTLTEVLHSLTQAGYSPATVVRPAWPEGRVGARRSIRFADPRSGGARGVLFVNRRGHVTGGQVNYGDRAAPGAQPWAVRTTTEAYQAVCDLWPTVDASWGHRVRP